MSFSYCVLGHSSSARLPKHLAVMRFGGGAEMPEGYPFRIRPGTARRGGGASGRRP